MIKRLISVLYIVRSLSNTGSSPSPCTGDHYKELGVDSDANAKQIRSGYRKASLLHHPDKRGNQDNFLCVSAAYEVLSDPAQRKLYDVARRFWRMAEGLEDPLQADFCAGWDDKVACAAELEEFLKEVFTNAAGEWTATQAQDFDFEAMRQSFEARYKSEFDEAMEALWDEFAEKYPKAAAVINGISYVHSFTIVKFMLAYYGSPLHQAWFVHFAYRKTKSVFKQLQIAVRSVTGLVKKLSRELIEAAGNLFVSKGIKAPPLEQTDTYVDVSDFFGGNETMEMYASDGELHRFKCCCLAKGTCQLAETTKTRRSFFVFRLFMDPNGCGRLVGLRWHSYRRLKRPCEIPEAEADELHDLKKHTKMEL